MPMSGATCVDLLRSQAMAVIGTRNGNVRLLDLRMFDIIEDVAVHNNSVQSIKVAIKGNNFEEAGFGTPEMPSMTVCEDGDACLSLCDLSVFKKDTPEFRISMQVCINFL